MTLPLSVAVQPRDGGWTELGNNHRYGVMPDTLTFGGDINEYGCLDANFAVKTNPRFPHFDLEQFTPVAIARGRDPRWSGRIIATPTTYGEEGVFHVQCQGWGQHLKDDPIDKIWAASKLGRFYETRASNITLQAAGTGSHSMEPRISIDDTGIMFASPKSGNWQESSAIGCVTLDLGPNNVAAAAFATYRSSNNYGANGTLYCRTSSFPDYGATLGTTSDAFTEANPNAGPTNKSGTFASPQRYVHVLLYWGGGAVAALAADVWIKITNITILTNTRDMSGGANVLYASNIIKDTLTAACPLISTDQSLITTTSFAIPEFPKEFGRAYPNQLVDAANAFHGYRTRLTAEPLPRFEFSAQSSDYDFVVGSQDDYTFENPSENDGRDVYSRIIVPYADATGVRAEASAYLPTNTASVSYITTSSTPQPANPSFAVDALHWTNTTRNTVQFDTTPAGGNIAGASVIAVSDAITGFQVGRAYRVRARMSCDIGGKQVCIGIVGMNNLTTLSAPNDKGAFTSNGTPGVFIDVYYDFVATSSSHQIQLMGYSTNNYYDTVDIVETMSNVVSRRGFTRTAIRPMDSAATAAAAAQIAQLELDSSQFPPLKGTLAVTGRIRTKGGESIDVSILPSRVGDTLLIENLRDPNTGALGRIGVIAAASYEEATDTCTITLDNPADFVSNIKARIAAG